ncbi:MAG: hypothetical protein JRC92_01635 [Deltaproteobacteria bacterium]|nr:hypothetical protein [Deltaproteobacteria bacterium]
MTWAGPAIAFRRGFRQLARQAPTLSLAAATMAVALVLAGLGWGLYAHLDTTALRLAGQARLIVYLDPRTTPDAGQALAQKVAAWKEVRSATSLSSAQALDRLKGALGQRAGLLDGLGAKVMPPLLEGELTPAGREKEGLAKVTGRLKKQSVVDEIAYAHGWAERLVRMTSLLKNLGLALAVCLSLAGLFIIFAAIRLSHAAHQEEIAILSLIGASPGFIRGPFLVQGTCLGLAAAGAALLLLWLLQTALNLGLPSDWSRLILVEKGLAVRLLAAGGVAGLIGARLALMRIRLY